MRLIRFAVIAIISLWMPGSVRADPPLTRAQMEADLKLLASTLSSAWAYHDDKQENPGVSVDDLLERSLRQLDEVQSDAQFGLVLREFMAGLREGHAEVYVGHLSPSPRGCWPLLLRPVKEGLVVVAVDPALQAKAGVARGDLLRSVDGIAAERLISDAQRYVSASSDGARRRLAIQRMAMTDAAAVEMELERSDGSRYRCRAITLDAPLREAEAQEKAFLSWRELEGGVGYIRIPTFAWQPPVPPKTGRIEDLDAALAAAKAQVDHAFAALSTTRSLILDLRGNQGGSVFLASYIAEHLLPPGFVYHSGERRKSPEALRLPDIAALPANYWSRAHAWRPSLMTGVKHHAGPSHLGRLVVLTDELCFSAVDDLLACLSDLHPDVRFVGRPTNGGTGESRVILKLEHCKADVQFCIMLMRSPHGRLIEGRGTTPDVAVEWSRDDIINGRDPDQAAAIREAR